MIAGLGRVTLMAMLAAAAASDGGVPWLGQLRVDADASVLWQMLIIILATFVSEDLTCIATGLLIHQGHVAAPVGVGACFAGIFLGDVGLWLVGYAVGRPVLNWRPVARWLPTRHLDTLADWYHRYGFAAVFAGRFLPGTRFPLYTTAGVLGTKAKRFVVWALVSCLIYTPIIVVAVALAGHVVADPLRQLLGHTWLALAAGVLTLFLIFRIAIGMSTHKGRQRLARNWRRLRQWEFWPMWAAYLPLWPWWAWLSLRYRGISTFTAANPGMDCGGGLVGESKYDILRKLPQQWIIPSMLAPPNDIEPRVEQVTRHMREHNWSWPLILKPDVGQRGAGVKRITDVEQLHEYLQLHTRAVLVQTYHPGPLEAGLFYVREPGQPAGRIAWVTDKTFPVITGDPGAPGLPLGELIRRHPRYRMQAEMFCRRHLEHLDRVLADGETFPLGIAGNHIQGTMFTDGSHLITPALEQRLDQIVKHHDGFYFGRCDVRYADAQQLKRGEGFAILELNGTSSEATLIYDPAWPIWRSYAVWFEQWRLCYRIGHLNRRRGHRPIGVPAMLRLYFAHRRTRDVEIVAD